VSGHVIGPLEVGLGLSTVVPFTPEHVFYDLTSKTMTTQPELFQTFPVALVGDLGLGLAF
jgi:hypothetical protein